MGQVFIQLLSLVTSCYLSCLVSPVQSSACNPALTGDRIKSDGWSTSSVLLRGFMFSSSAANRMLLLVTKLYLYTSRKYEAQVNITAYCKILLKTI
jgi:hypothetical protein